MKKFNLGFTLIELVVVIIVLGILAVIAAPKFLDLRTDAETSVLKGMQGGLKSARDLVAAQIALRPENLSADNRSFTLENGQAIEVRGQYPDGRWEDTFDQIVDFDSVTFVTSNQCTETNSTTAWCAREKNRGWFNNRGYIAAGVRGRGFVIFPQGNNVNQDACYLYYFTPNRRNVVGLGSLPIVELDLTDCS